MLSKPLIQFVLFALLLIIQCGMANQSSAASNAKVVSGSFSGYSFIRAKSTGGVFNLPSGTTAQRPVCTSTISGLERFNTTTAKQEVCTGTAWVVPMTFATGGTPPSPNQGIGYFVLSAGQWNANLGGANGADSKCYSDLMANDWLGKSDASARGLMNSGRIKAFLCEAFNCEQPMPLSTYQFAKSGDPSAGGARFSTDVMGNGPGNQFNWTGRNYFNTSARYWTFRGIWDGASETQWGYGKNMMAHYNEASCTGFKSADPADKSAVGDSSRFDGGRWNDEKISCDKLARLVCLVHP